MAKGIRMHEKVCAVKTDEKKVLEATLTELRRERLAIENVFSDMRRKERVCLFIDNSDLFSAVQNNTATYGKRVDYIKLREFLANGRSVNASKFYFGEPSFPKEGSDPREIEEAAIAAKKRQGFYYVLQRAGYTTVCLPQHDEDYERGLDIELVYDMCALSRAGAFDTFVLVAGDENYARTVSRIRQDTGISVEVAFFANSCSYKLRQAANKFCNLGDQDVIQQIFFELE
jgi:uncharacterized LabA/DUF88 family protein